MAFPSIAATATSAVSTNETSHAINLPSGIVSGQTLSVFVRFAAAVTITWPSGWTVLFADQSDASDDTTAKAWRKADGTEGATITLTTSASCRSTALAWRVADAADPTVSPPVYGTIVTGTSTAPDPGSITPVGGAKDYLFLALGGWGGHPDLATRHIPDRLHAEPDRGGYDWWRAGRTALPRGRCRATDQCDQPGPVSIRHLRVR